jgi:hypothetical protein
MFWLGGGIGFLSPPRQMMELFLETDNVIHNYPIIRCYMTYAVGKTSLNSKEIINIRSIQIKQKLGNCSSIFFDTIVYMAFSSSSKHCVQF